MAKHPGMAVARALLFRLATVNERVRQGAGPAELADEGVLVTSACPGFVASDMGAQWGAKKSIPDGAAGVVWLWGGLASAVFGHGWPTPDLSQSLAVLIRLPSHAGDPADAWPVSQRPRLPGPGGFYAALGLLGGAARPASAASPGRSPLYSRAVKLFWENRFEESVELYKKALDREPDKAALLTDLGLALARLGRRAEAEVYFRRAIERAPRRWFAYANLAEMVMGACADAGVSPGRLELEVTEAAFLAATKEVLAAIDELRRAGVRIVMDDFGTGYSSLATLHAFPFDKIKLDQSFVRRLPNDAAAAAIVRTVLALGESLGIPVLAEGIETEAQWQVLAREGCAKGQGYLFAKPVSLAQLPAAVQAAARFARDDGAETVVPPRIAIAI